MLQPFNNNNMCSRLHYYKLNLLLSSSFGFSLETWRTYYSKIPPPKKKKNQPTKQTSTKNNNKQRNKQRRIFHDIKVGSVLSPANSICNVLHRLYDYTNPCTILSRHFITFDFFKVCSPSFTVKYSIKSSQNLCSLLMFWFE